MTRERQVYGRALRLVARDMRLPVKAVRQPQGAAARRARQVAAYVACVAGDVGVSRLASVAGVNLYTIQNALARIEDARDDREFDSRLDKLEQELCA